jgi:hypothetical protein
MPDKKISQLTSALSLDGDEQIPIVQGGVTKKTTIDDINQTAHGYIILRSTGPGAHLFKFVCDDTGMIVMPGEDLGV